MTFVGLALRNALRNRVRTALTIVAVALAIVTFTCLQTVPTAWNEAAEHAAQDRVVTRHKISFVIPLPKRYIDAVRGFDGVEGATWASWVGSRDPKNPQNFFAVMAVDTETYFDVYDEMLVPEAQLDAWKVDRRGAILGDVLARQLGVTVGDKVTLEGTIYPGTFEYTVDGIYEAARRSVDRMQFIIHWDYLNESLPETDRDQIGWIVARVSDPSASASLAKSLDTMFDSRDVPTISMSERAFQTSFLGMFSALLAAIQLVSGIILLILLLILGNTVAMGVRERTQELAVLRALGFRPKHVVALVLGESTLMGILAGVLGLVLSFVLVERLLGRFIEENMGSFFPYFRIAPSTYVAAALLAVALGALAGAVPAFRTARLDVTSALRRVA